MAGSDLDWYAVAVRPRQESKVDDGLKLRRVDRFLPKYSRVVRRGHARQFVERMLFPGYVFVGFEPHRERWQAVRDTAGVIGPVMHLDGSPWLIRTFDMEEIVRNELGDVVDHRRVCREIGIGDLMARCLRGEFDEHSRRLGQRVQFSTIKIGPLLSREKAGGRIVGLEADGRVRVLFGGGRGDQVERMTLDEIALAG